MAGGHRWLIVLTLAVSVTIILAQLDNVNLGGDRRFNKMLPEPQLPTEENEITQSTVAQKLINKMPSANDHRFNKMLPAPQPEADLPIGILKEEPLSSSTKSITVKPVIRKETTPNTVSTTESSSVDLVKKVDIAHSEVGKNHLTNQEDEEDEDEYFDNEYYDDDNIDTSMTANKIKTMSSLAPKVANKDDLKLKPIKGSETNSLQEEHHLIHLIDNNITPLPQETEDEDSDDEYDDDEDEDVDTVAGTPASGKTINEGHGNCPMNCICEINFNGFRVASCDRLDVETMKFDSSISDLEVVNVPPKYPLVLGEHFFKKIGLAGISSIKIVDSTIEVIHPSAFEGLNQLYAVNLTNTGLDVLHPDTFANNTKLRILTLTGNDLHAMQQKFSPFFHYMLNAPNVEELYLSRCNLKTLLPTAFVKLDSIVFISLAENLITTFPKELFWNMTTLEELDLSSNAIRTLHKHQFQNTSLSILNMRYNEIGSRLDIIAPELQQLDLGYNKLINIDDLMFVSTKGIKTLNLKGNAIHKIHHAAFAPLKDLHHIDLSFNELEQVSSLMFMANVDLYTIRLNDNAHLSKLPLDGFVSERKVFNVYLFDVSNCDLNELGDKTFSTMPEIVTLNLAWNNIEVLSKGLFVYLPKLIKLDLSNNMITDLNDQLFLHNRKVRKINLAGNPLDDLSPIVFLPTKQLNVLDLSDCNLKTFSTKAKLTKKSIFQNLRSLNVSHNEIKQIRVSDLQGIEKLTVLDISNNNKIKCDQEFKKLMRTLTKEKVAAGSLRQFIQETSDHELVNDANRTPWELYEMFLCNKTGNTKILTDKPKSTPKVDKDLEDDSSMYYSDDDDEDVESTKDSSDEDDSEDSNDDDDIIDDVIQPNVEKQSKTNTTSSTDVADGDEDDYSYDDDDDNDEEEIKLTDIIKNVKVKEQNKIDVSVQKPKVEFVTDDNDDDDDDSESDEEFAIENDIQSEYAFEQYAAWVPVAVILFVVLLVLTVVAKTMSILMRRRGERYRQALLASKNSIVYQKLSEDIAGPTTPKFHRYAPIEQV